MGEKKRTSEEAEKLGKMEKARIVTCSVPRVGKITTLYPLTLVDHSSLRSPTMIRWSTRLMPVSRTLHIKIFSCWPHILSVKFEIISDVDA